MVYSFSISNGDMSVYNKLGLNAELILREAGIPPRAVANGKFVLTREQYKAMYVAIGNQIGQDRILDISTIDAKPAFVPATFVGLCASDGVTCIKRVARYKRLIAPYMMLVTESSDSISVTYEFEDGEQLPDFTVLYEQINLLSILRKGMSQPTLKPLEVAGNCRYPNNIIDYIRVSPKKENTNKLVFDKKQLNRPFITENNNMWEYLEKELNQRLDEMEIDNSFSAVVRKILFELLPSGISDVEKIAQELGVSKRTLQRKLKDEHTTYNEQLNHTRELMVRNYLKMDMSLDEIAFLVNYIDTKSLSRAFKVWTGMSITEYKNQL